MKKIEGKITVLFNPEVTTIELRDKNSGTLFAEVELTPEQLSSAFARIGRTDCSINVQNLDRVGKKQEHQVFKFEINKSSRNASESELRRAAQYELDTLPEYRGEGWIADESFRSKETFEMKEDSYLVSCTIRRYVDE